MPVWRVTCLGLHDTVSTITEAPQCSAIASARTNSGLMGCAGVPLTMVIRLPSNPLLTIEWVRTALQKVPFACVRLPYSFLDHPGPLGLVSALAGSVSTLTELRGLPAAELEDSQERGLAAFTRLRALTVRQTPESPVALSATLLPACLVELEIEAADPLETGSLIAPPPLGAFRKLDRLRRMVYTDFAQWNWAAAPADNCSFRRAWRYAHLILFSHSPAWLAYAHGMVWSDI